jgi:hypothetical protein
VKIPRKEWTLKERDRLKEKIGKEMGVTWLNMGEHLEYIVRNLPSLQERVDITHT